MLINSTVNPVWERLKKNGRMNMDVREL